MVSFQGRLLLIAEFVGIINASIFLSFMFVIVYEYPWIVTEDNISISLNGPIVFNSNSESQFLVKQCFPLLRIEYLFILGILTCTLGIISMWLGSRILSYIIMSQRNRERNKRKFLKLSGIFFGSASLFFISCAFSWRYICLSFWQIYEDITYTQVYISFILVILFNVVLAGYNLFHERIFQCNVISNFISMSVIY